MHAVTTKNKRSSMFVDEGVCKLFEDRALTRFGIGRWTMAQKPIL